MAASPVGFETLIADLPQIWEFPVADFLVCAREDVHGLFLLSSTAKLAWELTKTYRHLPDGANIFAKRYGITTERAREDLDKVQLDWSSGLLAARALPALNPAPVEASNGTQPVFSAEYSLFGKIIGLRLYDADIVLDLAPRVEPLRVSPSHPHTIIDVLEDRAIFHVLVDGCRVASEETLYAARVVVLQEFLKASSPGQWSAILHAGACGSGSDCLIFPASSHSGKTTLAAALLHQGMTFFGDDSIPLESGSLKVQPMPFALMIREGSWPVISAMFPELNQTDTVDRWGERVRFLSPPVPAQRVESAARAIVFTQYQAGTRTDLQRLPAFEALLRLEASGFWVGHDRDNIGAFLTWFASLPSYCLAYSDLAEAGEVLRSLLAT